MAAVIATPILLGVPFVCFAQATYSGIQPDQAFSVPDNAVLFRFELARIGANATFWTSSSQSVSWLIAQSNDGGTTWIPRGGSTAVGGLFTDHDTASQSLSSFDETPLLPGTSRQMKVSWTASGTPMVTIGKVTAK
jgi:hypothetical protein